MPIVSWSKHGPGWGRVRRYPAESFVVRRSFVGVVAVAVAINDHDHDYVRDNDHDHVNDYDYVAGSACRADLQPGGGMVSGMAGRLPESSQLYTP